ncbi:MAG: DUF4143 domain-containing protein [Acidimicrobiaceae bacterium]|nr:DUF4143 domain-containing protein [Acidimicrobiaceae bacterium]
MRTVSAGRSGGPLVPAGYQQRLADAELDAALAAVGWVLLEGPRACGKTWTALSRARSAARLDIDVPAHELGRVQPAMLLEGDRPRLIDEWQTVPEVWNHARHAVDASGRAGQFIFAGSASPADDITRHTGAGRLRRIRMRPMCLWESGHSTGEVSLSALLDGATPTAPAAGDLAEVAAMVCRGGWPALVHMPVAEAQRTLRDYLGEAARTDVRRLDGSRHHRPAGVERLIRSLARNTATEADYTTLMSDTEPDPMHRHTVREYLEALRRVFLVEEQPAWSGHLRSKAALRKSPKWHLADPSLAAAALHASPDRLVADPATLGNLVESLAVRDLRILSQGLEGRVTHLRDASGQEADAVVECGDGRMLLAEVKLGGGAAIEEAARKLKRINNNMPEGRSPRLVVLTTVGRGYSRDDGVAVVPITALGP